MSAQGEILARRSRADGAGVITADIELGNVATQRIPIPNRFWIPDMPEGEDRDWKEQLKTGHEYYLSHTLPF